MQIEPPVHLIAQPRSNPSVWEIGLRYVAATLVTLLSIAGAQLVVRNDFVLLMAALTILGVPVSLYLRLHNMKIGPVRVPRVLWNTVTVLGTFIAATYFIFWSLRDLLGPVMSGGSPQMFWLRFGGSDAVILLVQVFLIFAAFRSFALISDKDATLATVPSFSVLLLLIPVHKGIEVVLYFLAWTVVATFLFALDHRSEVRASASATVPSISAGQDVRLAARSLSTILGLSLISAIGISYFLSSRDADGRSSTENAISSLATRLTNLALSLPETSINSGPERQIDFSSSPGLASHSALWQVQAWTYRRRWVRPEYWRLFSLDFYNGATWSQGRFVAKHIRLSSLNSTRWPTRREMPRPDSGNFTFNSNQIPNGSIPPARRFFGFDVEHKAPHSARQFGPPNTLVRQNITAMLPNIGYLPIVPSVRAIMLPDSEQKEIQVSPEGGFDLGVNGLEHTARVLSDVPSLPEYGITRREVPTKKLSASALAKSGIFLSPFQRQRALQLPVSLPLRVRNLATEMLRDAPRDFNNLRLAQRLALGIQENATYTLRPPTIPTDRDATDYFLFDSGRRGYCTYFAGALTVLCRTQGIPARVVSGFVNAEWSKSGQGILREANAHAWTEVWVDGWGWAVVDATPTADRGDNAPTWIENWGDLFASQFSSAVLLVRTHIIWVGAFALVGVIMLLMRWNRRFIGAPRGARFYDEDGERRAVIDIYKRVSRHIARRFRPRARWETPDEWVEPFAATLAPSDAESLRRLTALYLRARYAARPLPSGSAQLARETAARIGWKRPSA